MDNNTNRPWVVMIDTPITITPQEVGKVIRENVENTGMVQLVVDSIDCATIISQYSYDNNQSMIEMELDNFLSYHFLFEEVVQWIPVGVYTDWTIAKAVWDNIDVYKLYVPAELGADSDIPIEVNSDDKNICMEEGLLNDVPISEDVYGSPTSKYVNLEIQDIDY